MSDRMDRNIVRPAERDAARVIRIGPDAVWALGIQVERCLSVGDRAHAMELNARLLSLYAGAMEDGDMEVAEELCALAERYAAKGHADLAATLLRRLCEAHRKALGDDDPRLLSELELLARYSECLMECHKGDAVWARRLIWESRSRTLGELHPNALAALERLARTCDINLDWTEAAKRYEQLYNARRRTLGEHDPRALAALERYLFTCLVYLEDGEELDELGGYRHLLPYCQRHCEEMLRVYGEADTFSANALAQLAQCYAGLGEKERAYQSWARAHRACCRAEGEGSVDARVYLHNWALSCEELGEMDRALPLWKRLYEMCSASEIDESDALEALEHIQKCQRG